MFVFRYQLYFIQFLDYSVLDDKKICTIFKNYFLNFAK